MGQCYGKTNPTAGNISGDGDGGAGNTTTIISDSTSAGAGEFPPPSPPYTGGGAGNGVPSVKNTPGRSSNSSPWPSPYPQGGGGFGVSPSPARGTTPRRFFRRPFPPPSPAKHIRASLAKRLGGGKPKEGPIPEEREGAAAAGEGAGLDKSFGYSKNFGGKYELGKEVGRGHFGHTCSARGKKGELRDHPLAVKIISKAKV